MESILVGIFGFVAVLLSVAISLLVGYFIYLLIIIAIDTYRDHRDYRRNHNARNKV